MGTTLSSIHIFSDSAPVNCGFSFQSFSPNWQTCTDDFSEKEYDYPYKAAKIISKSTDAPVLHFEVYDSEMIWFEFLRNGKVVSRYSDDDLVANKKLFAVPSLVGCGEGQKRRLSSLLSCSDIDFKIEMLEEYLGVCLLYLPELSDDPKALHRDRSDTLFRKYREEEKALTGKAAPIHIGLIAEYSGKLFENFFTAEHDFKPHYFLYGYTQDDYSQNLTPVRFTGKSLEKCDLSTFSADRRKRVIEDPCFKLSYRTPCKVTFTDECPSAYRGKTMILPNGFFPQCFTKNDELLLLGNHRIFVADSSLKIIAKLSVKGDVADILDDYILTTAGGSFYAYCYEPRAKIFIYKLERA